MFKVILDIITDLVTIFGFFLALWIYLKWKKDYSVQKSHEYAIEMLRKLYMLHGLIEELRGPKFYFADSVENELKDVFIPKINQLVAETKKVRSDFLIAKNILSKNKNIIEKFNTLITDGIIKKFRFAVYMFPIETKKNDKSYNETKLWKLIFPSECIDFTKISDNPIKRSTLGTNEEVHDDDFNKSIENGFQELYELLNQELIQKILNRDLLINIMKIPMIILGKLIKS